MVRTAGATKQDLIMNLNKNNQEIGLESFRWVELAVFCLSMLASAYVMTTFSAISVMTYTAYETESLTVSWFYIEFTVSCFLLNFPFIKLIEKLGLQKSVSNITF